jgi:hypothetical protein
MKNAQVVMPWCQTLATMTNQIVVLTPEFGWGRNGVKVRKVRVVGAGTGLAHA